MLVSIASNFFNYVRIHRLIKKLGFIFQIQRIKIKEAILVQFGRESREMQSHEQQKQKIRKRRFRGV